MNTVQLFTIFAALLCSQVLCNDCNNYEDCVTDVTHSTLVVQNIFMNEFNKHLEIRLAVKDNVNNLHTEMSNGPSQCVSNFHLHVEKILEACGTLDYVVVSDVDQEILSYPEDYFENGSEEDKQRFCKAAVPVINGYCKIFEHNKAVLETCDIEEKFDELYRQPWLACVNAAQ